MRNLAKKTRSLFAVLAMFALVASACSSDSDGENTSGSENGGESVSLPECLTFADLYALTGPESEGFASWSDANDLSSELGGEGALPEQSLTLIAPGEESGTYDTFVEFHHGGSSRGTWRRRGGQD